MSKNNSVDLRDEHGRFASGIMDFGYTRTHIHTCWLATCECWGLRKKTGGITSWKV